jgi:hypothetical protein
MTRRSFTVLLAGLIPGACRNRSSRAQEMAQQVVVWRTVGSWAGRGSRQTESFTSDTGTLRIRWTTRNEDPGGGGRFRLSAHSAISGRLLEQVVDHQGTGGGLGYVNQDPHVFYLMVESDHLDWKVSVEEAVAGTVTGKPQ